MVNILAAVLLAGPTHFAIVGDFGKDGVPEANVAAMIAGWNPDFVVTTGDNNYETGAASTIETFLASTSKSWESGGHIELTRLASARY